MTWTETLTITEGVINTPSFGELSPLERAEAVLEALQPTNPRPAEEIARLCFEWGDAQVVALTCVQSDDPIYIAYLAHADAQYAAEFPQE